MTGSRPWLAAVLALFALPLFVGLGNRDLRGDEAAHSFSVDRILESGDWLAPKRSPSETEVFLEKPPLKFWIVAAPIKLGLLPDNEFGLRFWDAFLGGLAFLYVFAIGRRLAGDVCGAVSVLILFVHYPLLFEHGLRGNNMEAALLLCYCGGMYHYMAAMAQPAATRRRHAVAVGLYFALGFMTKFVAALFLPIVLGVASLLFREWRAKLARDARLWAGVGALALGLIAPWFIYTQIRFGALLWQTMFGAHVYTRFTSYLDPTHLHPWSFYFVTMYSEFAISGATLLVGGGLLLLLVQTVRTRWADGGTVLLWLGLPTVLISLGTSKLYHYAYPFLPPAALAGGYLVAMLRSLLLGPLEYAMRTARAYLERSTPRLRSACDRPAVRVTLLTLAAGAVAIAVVSVVHGQLRITVGHTDIFKSGGVLRPAAVVIVAGALTGVVRSTSRIAALLVVVSLLPMAVYRDVLGRLSLVNHPMRAARDCLLQVESQPANASGFRGLWVDGVEGGFGGEYGHEHYYYFRKVQPWQRAPTESSGHLAAYLYNPAEQRPILTLDSVYQGFMHRAGEGAAMPGASSPPMVSFGGVVLLLPGPYAVCSSEANRTTNR